MYGELLCVGGSPREVPRPTPTPVFLRWVEGGPVCGFGLAVQFADASSKDHLMTVGFSASGYAAGFDGEEPLRVLVLSL